MYIRYLLSLQTWGLLPVFVVMFLHNYLDDSAIAFVSLGLSLLSWLLLSVWKIAGHIPARMLGVSAVTLLAFSALKIGLSGRWEQEADILLLSMLYLLFLLLFQTLSTHNLRFFPMTFFPGGKNKMGIGNFMKYSNLHKYAFSLYLVVLAVYYAEGQTAHPETFRFLNCYFNQMLIGLLLVWEIAMGVIKAEKSMKEGIWLPVLDNNLDTVKYVSAEESLRLGKKYIHPHVRVIVMCGTKIYLQKNNDPDSLSEAAVDTPFSADVAYGETIDDCIDWMLSGVADSPHREVKPLLKTRYENETLRRVVYLNLLNVKEEQDMDNVSGLKGQFWTPEQIEENLHFRIFSDCFEQEYEFLKNTILLAYRYVNGGKIE